jgi:peptidoglycan/xylan/chitin deacetylase (PgdA/CDA1 family)
MIRASKDLAEIALLKGGPAFIARRAHRKSSLILAYHNVVPEDQGPCGDTSLHLPVESFANQLDQLVAAAEVVPLGRLLEPRSPADDRPRVAITFDDAYRGALTLGFDELARRGLPATVFVAPGLLNDTSFWWDLLGLRTPARDDPQLRDWCLAEHRGEQVRILEWLNATAGGAPDSPSPAARSVTEGELVRAAEQPGITLASHTWSHPNLTRLQGKELENELKRANVWLQDRFKNVLPWLAYPYGLHSARVREAACSVGYAAAVAVTGGWITPEPGDRYALSRLNIPAGLSRHGFAVRLAGLLC